MRHDKIAICVGSPAWAGLTYNELVERRPASPFYLVHECGNAELRRVFTAIPPRYAFFLNWSRRVAPDVLALSECINFHCTWLPFGRGGNPIENLILRGFTETVITAHRMTEELDAGDIYMTSGPVSLAGTKPQITARFAPVVAGMIREILTCDLTPVPQTGPVVKFRRLSHKEYESLWKERERENSSASGASR